MYIIYVCVYIYIYTRYISMQFARTKLAAQFYIKRVSNVYSLELIHREWALLACFPWCIWETADFAVYIPFAGVPCSSLDAAGPTFSQRAAAFLFLGSGSRLQLHCALSRISLSVFLFYSFSVSLFRHQQQAQWRDFCAT